MQTSGESKRVRLTVDLTRYDPRCKIGELGWTMPDMAYSSWAKFYDRFVAVKFDNGAKLDVLTKSIEQVEDDPQQSKRR